MFFSLLRLVFIIYCQKQKQKITKKKKKKRSNWTKLPRKLKEENNNNNRQRPNQKEKNNNKEEGIGIVQYLQTEPKSKKKKQKKRDNGLDKPMSKYTWVFSSFIYQISPTQFSFYFEEKIFCWVQGENTWTLPIFFSPLPQPNTYQKSFHSHFLFKIFLPIFFSKFSIGKISNSWIRYLRFNSHLHHKLIDVII